MPEAKVELVGQYAVCSSPGCHGYELIKNFEIQEIDADAKGGWEAKGKGQTCRCPRCGSLCDLITLRLPVELQ